MNFKYLKVFLVCIISVFCLAGCNDKSELKDILASVDVTLSLPEVTDRGCMYLSEADDAVYEQQIAACELYYEAYYLTRTSDYVEKYKGQVDPELIAYYCNNRRSELVDEISEDLRENIREIVETVQDCETIDAYIDRVVYDTLNFYDYYADYVYAENDEEFVDSACNILKVFYERTNILAFSFMKENKDDFVSSATYRIVNNSNAHDTYSMYITENNDIIEALNVVYNGVDSNTAEIIHDATIKLIRKMLEDDNELDTKSINALMEQLGEPTPTPEPTPEPTPSELPQQTQTPTPEPTPVPPTQAPIRPEPPVQHTQKPVSTPVPTEEIYIFE